MICFLLLASVFPGLYWEKGADTAAAVQKAGVERVYVPAASVAAWSAAGLKAVAADPAKLAKAEKPGVEYRMNVASATSVPWINANGWRFVRDPRRTYYYDVPGEVAPLAMAEAYAYGVEALVHPAGDLQGFGEMLAFLRKIDRPAMPALVNIGVIDDGSDISGEAMNLLARRNLLFRVVKAPDPKLDLTVNPEKEGATDPYAFAQKVRQRLGDDKRLVRLYGSDVVLARLTGERGRARLHLINYTNRKVIGMRVRLRGTYAKGTIAGFGEEQPALVDYAAAGGATEFTISEMGTYAVVDLGEAGVHALVSTPGRPGAEGTAICGARRTSTRAGDEPVGARVRRQKPEEIRGGPPCVARSGDAARTSACATPAGADYRQVVPEGDVE